MECQRCHAENLAEAKFCRKCGARLHNVKTCNRCSAENPAYATFCANCGAQFKRQPNIQAGAAAPYARAGGAVFGKAQIFSIVLSLVIGFTLGSFVTGTIKEPSVPSERLAQFINEGNKAFDENRFAEAIEHYTKAVALEEENANVRVDLGTAYFYNGDPRRGIKEYQSALTYEPNHLNARYNLGVVNKALGNYEEAIGWWKSFLELNPDPQKAAQARANIEEAERLLKETSDAKQ